MATHQQHRILIYSHDAYGLGNIRRTLSICRQLTNHIPNVSILLLTGSPVIQSMRIPQNVDYVKLPCVTRQKSESFEATYWEMDVKKLIEMRSDLILSAIKNFQPNLVIVDKKPLGIKRELYPSLVYLREHLPLTSVVLGLRDILDDPAVTTPIWKANKYFETIETFYHEVWIFGSRQVFDAVRAYQMPPGVARKVIYTGYLIKPTVRHINTPIPTFSKNADSPLSLIMVGGGGDGFPVLKAVIDGVRQGFATNPLRNLIFTGPEMPPEKRAWVQKVCSNGHPLRSKSYSTKIEEYIDAADVVVCMGGYNTTCEVLAYRKKALIIPRVNPVKEQFIRAKRLAEMGLINMLHPDDVTPKTIIRALEKTLRNNDLPGDAANLLDLNGLRNIEKLTRVLLNIQKFSHRYAVGVSL